jgi:restriction system protein
MAIPDYQTLMLPVLRLSAEGQHRVIDVIDRIADEFGLSAAEREQLLPSGKQRVLHNRIHWAKFYLTKAGLIDVPSRGHFVATGTGRELLAKKPGRIDVAMLEELSPAFQEFLNGQRHGDQIGGSVEGAPVAAPVTSPIPANTPEEQIENAYRALHSALASDLVERVMRNSPAFFERLIIELLVKMGYGGSHTDAAKQLGQSGDGGVDGVINEDRLGLDRVYIQAKCYSADRSIGRPDVQGFLGSLVGQGASKGVFVTTSTFSGHAKEFVRHLPQRIVLIDGTTLAELMIEHGVGVRTSRELELKKLDEDFFADED